MNWSEEDLSLAHIRNPDLGGNPKTTTGAASAPPDVLEAPIQEECTKFLQENGWRALRTDPVSDRCRGKGFGEPGMADYLYIRYNDQAVLCTMPMREARVRSEVDVMWIEWKRGKGGVVSKAQRDWHTKERAWGALTLIAGEDFPASVEGFKEWYRRNF